MSTQAIMPRSAEQNRLITVRKRGCPPATAKAVQKQGSRRSATGVGLAEPDFWLVLRDSAAAPGKPKSVIHSPRLGLRIEADACGPIARRRPERRLGAGKSE